MELRKCSAAELKKVRRLYIDSFPPAERKPFFFLNWKRRTGKMEIFEIYDGGFAGLCIFAFYKDLALLTFFAVSPEKRNLGIGGKVLDLIREKYSDRRIFLEIELPDGSEGDNIKLRRKNFYLRNGLKEADIKVNLFGIPMEILCFDCHISKEEYKELYTNTIGKTLTKNVKLI